MTNMEGIKPCPFCGGESTVFDSTSKRYLVPDREKPVSFAGCAACGVVIARGSKEMAIEAWNRRNDSSAERLKFRNTRMMHTQRMSGVCSTPVQWAVGAP